MINSGVGRIFRDIPQPPFREIGIDRVVGDEDIVVIRSGDGDPALPGACGEGIKQVFAGGEGVEFQTVR